MEVCMYMDCLMSCGYISREDWDAVSGRFGNLIEVNVPKQILSRYYKEKLKEKYNTSFWAWYCNESIVDDFDELIGFNGWYPFLADVKGWTSMLKEAKEND